MQPVVRIFVSGRLGGLRDCSSAGASRCTEPDYAFMASRTAVEEGGDSERLLASCQSHDSTHPIRGRSTTLSQNRPTLRVQSVAPDDSNVPRSCFFISSSFHFLVHSMSI